MDTDLSFDVRVSDVLKAHLLTNINSEKQSAQDYRTNLSFDRGSLEYAKGKLQVMGWDNLAVETWDDPLHLVGAVGIYRHPYGYDRQGFKVASQHYGFDTEALYADNFLVGGTSYPSFTTQEAADFAVAAAESLRRPAAGRRLPPASGAGRRHVPHRRRPTATRTCSRCESAATSGGASAPGCWAAPSAARTSGAAIFMQATGPLSFRTYAGTFDQSWYAFGGELSWDGPAGFRGYGELLPGAKRLSFVPGLHRTTRTDVTLAGLDSTGRGRRPHGLRDRDRRQRRGARPRPQRPLARRRHLDRGPRRHPACASSSRARSHEYDLIQDGISNSMTVTRLTWDRNWRYYLGREVKTSLDVEYTAFDYDPATPWNYQFWFPDGNFWLERTEHVVSVDRMVMLGGADALRVRPLLEVPVLAARNGVVRWKGTFGTEALDKRPKYAESRLQLGCDLNRMLRLTTDSRWVKYDDPFLGLYSGYLSHFAEATWTFAPGASLALGFGVDPYVIDEVLNEYSDIGRDVYLFARGATGATAKDNYYGLGPKIAAAERALENERVVQIKAIVHF